MEVRENGKQSNGTMVTEPHTDGRSPARDMWRGKLDFILSAIGFAVGIGNICRFPYLIMQNGGGAFLIPYFIFLTICGVPLFYLEVCLGQFSRSSCLHVWKFCPLFKGIGYMMVVLSFICLWYYIMNMAWVYVYLARSFESQLPWSLCNQDWNTVNCTGYADQKLSNFSFVNKSIDWGRSTASYEFYDRYILNRSRGVEEIGEIQWHLALGLTVAWVAMFLCLMKGVQSLGKAVYVTVILPIILLTIILVRGATLPGALEGILFYIKPDFSRLKDGKVWLQAASQVYFSLGTGWGGLVTMASYNKFNNNCLRDALICCIAEGLVSFYGGFAIYSIIGNLASVAKMDVRDVATSGPGLALVVYPEALSRLPVPQFWAIIFFLMLITLGIDSLFALFEVLAGCLTDSYPRLRQHKVTLTACLCIVMLLLGLPFTTQGGIYLYQLVDWYFATFSLLIISFLECVLIAWIYGNARFSKDITRMAGRPPPVFIRICWSFITPICILITLVIMCFKYSPPSYDEYQYPYFAKVFGNLLAMVSIVPLPVTMVYQILQAKGTLRERICYLIKPSPDWDVQIKGPDLQASKQSEEETSFL